MRHSLYSCPISVKGAVYKCIVRPILEYASPVWYMYLHSSADIKQLESVQRRAAKWICGSCWDPVSKQWFKSTDLLKSIEVAIITPETRLLYFYYLSVHSILHHHSSISSQYFSVVNRHSNPSALDTSISTINPYRFSFFFNSPFIWNNLPSNI